MDHRPRQERSRNRANQGVAAFISASTDTGRSATLSEAQYVRTWPWVQRSRRPSLSGLLRRLWSHCVRVGRPASASAGRSTSSDGLSAGEDRRWRRGARSKTATCSSPGVLGVISGVDAMLPPKMVVTASSGVAAVVVSAMTAARRTTIVAVEGFGAAGQRCRLLRSGRELPTHAITARCPVSDPPSDTRG
jgi:hypothetical protein